MKLSLVYVDNCRGAIEPTKRPALSEIDSNMNYNEDLADLKQLQQEKGVITKLQAGRHSLRYRPSRYDQGAAFQAYTSWGSSGS